MQNLIVILTIVAALVFLGLRLRTIWRNRNAPSCGGCCSGCGSLSDSSSPQKTLPTCKAPPEPR